MSGAPASASESASGAGGDPFGGRVVTSGTLLDGRVRHDQFRCGHRTGIEPVLLAASVAARPGQRVLEAGTGSGAALLCLAARVPGLRVAGVECDASTAAMARANFRANGLDPGAIQAADIESCAVDGAPFDHCIANPPWHAPASTPSPDAARDGAHRRDPHLLARWTDVLAAALGRRGSLTFIVGASALAGCVAAYERAGLGDVSLFPLWPRAGVPAKLVLVRAIKQGRGPSRMLPGLALHRADGAYTEEAEAILRDGAPLAF